MSHKGSCLCGAVAFEITTEIDKTGACHCDMCRAWSGGVYLGVEVPKGGLVVEDDSHVRTYSSSPWAERAFCGTCGSSLWYRITAEGPMQGVCHLGLGTLEAPSGIPLTEEIYIDRKPDGYSFAGDTKKMTKAEVEAMFASL